MVVECARVQNCVLLACYGLPRVLFNRARKYIYIVSKFRHTLQVIVLPFVAERCICSFYVSKLMWNLRDILNDLMKAERSAGCILLLNAL